jgi:hypothetical protein
MKVGHRQPEAALELAHSEGELGLAEGSDCRWLHLQLRNALTEKFAVGRRRRRLRYEAAHPVPAKAPVKRASCTVRVGKRDGRAAAAAAGQPHDLPGL